MGNKVLQELGQIKTCIHDVNKATFNKPENKKRNREVDVAVMMLFKNIYVLKDFVANPVETCRRITTEYVDLPYSKDFVELTKAVNCAHTKEQGVTLGKARIIEEINKIKDECIKKSEKLAAKIEENIKGIEKAQEVTNLSFDYETILRRYRQATENEYFTSYTAKNVEKIFIPAGIEITPAMTGNRSVQVSLNVYDKNQSNEFEYLNSFVAETAKDLTGKVAYVYANNNYLYQQQFNKSRFEFKPFEDKIINFGSDNKDGYYKGVMLREFESIPADSDGRIILEMVENMVKLTETRREKLLQHLDQLKEAYSSVSEVDNQIDLEPIYNKIVTDLIEPFDKMTITVEEYELKAEHLRLAVQNLLSIRDRLEELLDTVKLAPTNFVHVVDKIYKLLEKVMIKSTINKGKEHEAELIVTNNIIGEPNATK